MRRIAFALAAAVASLFLIAPDHAAVAAPSPLRMLAVGDSLTVGYGAPAGQGWTAEFVKQAAAAGTEVQITTLAVGGWGTADVLPQLAAAILATQPDLVVLSLGTNDAADPTLNGFEARYGKILTTLLDISPALIAPAWIEYSAAPGWMQLSVTEGSANDAIYRCLAARAWLGSRLAGLPDYQPITWTYLGPDGIHLTAGGYQVMGRQVYRAVRANYGWATIPDEYPALTGHRP